MEEIMQMSVLKLYRTAIEQLTSKLSTNNYDSVHSALRNLKKELLSINSDITNFSSRLSEIYQVQQSIAKAYINNLEEQINYFNKHPSSLNELEFKMRSCHDRIAEIMNERKKFLTSKFESINNFLSTNLMNNSNESNLVRIEPETPSLVMPITNQAILESNQIQMVIPECFRIKKNCEICSLFGKVNHAIKSRLEKLSLCKKCAIFHDNHKKILSTEERLNCSCFCGVSECPNKKLEAFKYLLYNLTGFESDEFCSEPSMVKKKRVKSSKTFDSINQPIVKTEAYE